MRLPFGKKQERKNPFEASLVLDTDEIKLVQASYNEKPFLWGVGKAADITLQVAGSVSAKEMGASAGYKKERSYDWDYWYNPEALPGFMPIERAKSLAIGAVSLASGSLSSSSDLKPLTENLVVSQNVGISPDTGMTLGPLPRATISVSPRTVPVDGGYNVSGTVTGLMGGMKPTQLFIRVLNPSGILVDAASISVSATGTYSYATRAGGTTNWVNGRYDVLVTYGVDQEKRPTSIKTSFEYAGFGPT